MTWYEVTGWGDWKVVPVQVIKQTAKTLIIREVVNSWVFESNLTGAKPLPQKTRDVRRAMNGDYFDSLEAANAAVVARYETKIEQLRQESITQFRRLEKWKEDHNGA